MVELSCFFNFNQRYAAFNGGDSPLKRYDHTHTRSENSNSTTIVQRCGYAGNGVSRAGVVVTLAKGKQNVSACIFDVETSCACALEPRIYNDCGNWSGPSTGLDLIFLLGMPFDRLVRRRTSLRERAQ